MYKRFVADCDRMAHSFPVLCMLVTPLRPSQLRAKPAPQEWSIVEIVGHLIDTEQLLRYRIARMCTLDQPAIIPYDQDAAVIRNGYQHADVWALLRTLERERATTLQAFRRLTPAHLQRTGWHQEAGLWTVAPVVTYLANHDEVHQRQIRAAVR